MIYYDDGKEEWVDEEDDTFRVSMTPEGGCPTEEFETQEEFWAWYYIMPYSM